MIAVPCKDYDSENVYAAVRSGIRALGGMKAFLRPEEWVLDKPNLLKPADADSAVTTHPEVLRAVLRLLEEYGCQFVRFGDSPGHDSGTHAVGAPWISSGREGVWREADSNVGGGPH